VEFVARKDPATAFDSKLTVAARIVKAALARGVISRALPNADTIAFSPPLIITESEIDTLVTGMRDAADLVMAELIEEGSWRS
jgi:L-2,4-diaminobutyrate transaminase